MLDKKVTIFRDLFQSKEIPHIITLEKCIQRIKEGKNKELIKEIRECKDKEERNRLKKKLPCILFAGEFKERSKEGLDQHSGMCIIDFDNFQSRTSMKFFFADLCTNPHVITAFTSPSGDGIKAVISIPECTKEEHEKYFKAFNDEFNYDYFDRSNCDVSRVCFESYDPNIYVNEFSEVFSPKLVDEGFTQSERASLLPVTDDDLIIKKIMEFNWNLNYTEGQRNQYIFALAGAFCEYGVNQYKAEEYIINYVLTADDFSEREARTTVKNAYKQRVHGSKFFEDWQKIKRIKQDLPRGKEFIQKTYSINDDTYDQIKESKDANDFWIVEQTKNGPKIKVLTKEYKFFLERNGFAKYFPYNTQKPTWVQITSNKVQETSVEKIKDFVLTYLLERGDDDVWSYFANYQNLFSEQFLLMLDTVKLMILKDSKSTSYIAYENGIVKITKDKIEIIDYIDISGYIWKSHIIPREFIRSKSQENEYKKFIGNIAGSHVDSFESTVGFLLSNYKNKMNNQAVILNDPKIGDNPEGGTGKGLFIQGIRQIRKVSILDGKSFDDKKSFPYQTVSPETQILVFDDVKKNFDFETKFSLVTEGMTLERKNKDAIKLTVEDSPKMVISTNYPIKGSGNSHERRRHELVINEYYGREMTPYDEFGHQLFDDWDHEQFQRFDNYMVGCIQKYLKNGLTEQIGVNHEQRQLFASTCAEFIEWAEDDNLPLHTTLYKNELFDRITEEYTDLKRWMSKKKFSQYLEIYGSHKGYKIISGKTNNIRWIEYSLESPIRQEADEVWDEINEKAKRI